MDGQPTICVSGDPGDLWFQGQRASRSGPQYDAEGRMQSPDDVLCRCGSRAAYVVRRIDNGLLQPLCPACARSI